MDNKEMKTQRRFEVMGEDIFKIVDRIQRNQTILKLLKFTDTNPLAHEDLTQQEIDEMLHKNLLIVPKLPDEDQDKNCYIVVILDKYDVDPVNSDFKSVIIRFDVVCPFDKWIINGKTLRPYLILNELDKIFNEKKLAGIGNLRFVECNRLVVSPYLGGYTINYGHFEFN